MHARIIILQSVFISRHSFIKRTLSFFKKGLSFLATLFLCGCAALLPLVTRTGTADNLAKNAGFEKTFIKTSRFQLTSYYRLRSPGEPLTVYIEGDGLAWISRNRASDDPTPMKPLVLKLAMIDPSTNVVYLARPGQYTESGIPDCDPAYWISRRFSEEVIRSMNEAIDQFSAKAGSKTVHLIGYSGGAAVAVLIAERRTDVASLRTIAGNLNPGELSRYHGISSLDGSLDPLNSSEKLKNIPQRHFVGSKDMTVPYIIAKSFVEREGDKDTKRITVVEGATHKDGWLECWGELLSMPLSVDAQGQ